MKEERTPLISVIVPIYKAEKYLHRCVDSLLAQTFQDFEVLLVDDGSPDRSGEICDEYAKKDSRVRVFHKENGGVGSARNLGLKVSKGEWIAFLDSDDTFKKDYLYRMYGESCNVDGVICGFEIYSNEEMSNIVRLPEIENVNDLEVIWLALGKLEAEHYIWNHIYKSSIIRSNEINFREISTGEDTLFNLEYFRYAKAITILSYVGYVHYDNPNSLSKGYRVDYDGFYNEYMRLFPIVFDCEKNHTRKYFEFVKMSYLYGYIFNIKAMGSPFSYANQIELIEENLLNGEVLQFMRTVQLKKKSWILFRFLISLNSAFILELFYRLYMRYLKLRKK